jgi:hypothetical protein
LEPVAGSAMVLGTDNSNMKEKGSSMAITLTEENGGALLEVQLTGRLRKEDYQRFVPEFERLIKEHGKLNLLLEMRHFLGWTASALWEDIKFDARHFADIDRIAMVGDKKWEKGMATFCRPFTRAKIRFFEPTAVSEARAWARGEARTSDQKPAGTEKATAAAP